MGKRVIRNLVVVMMVAGLALTMSCAKKNIGGDNAALLKGNTAEISPEEAARRAAQEKARLMEEQRLQEQALQEDAARQRNLEMSAREQFENQDILFGYDSAVLSAEARHLLKIKANWLEANPARNIVVQGHCDERGTTEYNLALGDQRASAVKAFLMDLGISGARITTISYGEEKPLDPGTGEGAWARNRRAHFVIL
ncbi:peptidoglycan-associated lipoprotein Pal [Desulfocicer niacini]